MKVLQIATYESDLFKALDQLKVVTKNVPTPGPGQVLIKVEASPCNPSDLSFLQKRYGFTKTLPAVPGWEGAGTVVASGGGFLSWWLKGKRVGFYAQGDRDGAWAEYCIADSNRCCPLKDNVPIEQGAAIMVNPLTAIGLVRTALSQGHKALVQTAAASQLGRMIINLAARENVPLINIVRRDEQVQLLKSLGSQYVLNSEDPSFAETLKNMAAQLKATGAFDAVAGEMTGILLNALPPNSIVYLYGGLSGGLCGNIRAASLIFEGKKLEGFLIPNWLNSQGTLGALKVFNEVQKLMTEGVIQTTIFKEVALEDAPAALKEYAKEMTRGKVFIKPSLAQQKIGEILPAIGA